MFYIQASPGKIGKLLKPSIGAFNLLRLESQHCRANKKLLVDVCLAHASWADKTGEELQEALTKSKNIPPLKDLSEGTPIQFNVGFYAANMFKGGPLCDLLSEALRILSIKHRNMKVFVFGDGSDFKMDGKTHPSVKQLWEHFEHQNGQIMTRICFDESSHDKADARACAKAAAVKFKIFREAHLHAFFALQGWTGESDELGAMLWCRVAPLQFNYLEFAGVMHAPRLVDFTLLGQAVGNDQRECDTRERLAVFDEPGSYQPPQCRSLAEAVRERLKDQAPKYRAFLGIPAESFAVLPPGSTERICEDNMHLYFEIAQCIPNAIIIFFEKPAPMRGLILKKLADFNRDITTESKRVEKSRLIFHNWMHDKCDFWEFMKAVCYEGGGGTTICSFGPYAFHTGSSDSLMNNVPIFTWKDPNGSTQQRVSAEIVTAAGLAWPCVSETAQDTVKAVVHYARDPALRQIVQEHLQKAQSDELGYYDPNRVPDGLAYAVNAAYTQFIEARGDRSKLRDFQIPYTRPKLNPLRSQTDTAAEPDKREKLWKLLTDSRIAVELQALVVEALLGIEEETGGSAVEFVGDGASVATFRISFPNGEQGVIKVMKTGCKPHRMHNRSVYREARNLELWYDKLIRHQFLNVLPKPLMVLKNKTCFFGHTLPNDNDDVALFLICEYIPRSFWDVAETHQQSWQEDGIFLDSLRVLLLQPMFHGLFWAQRNASLALIVRDLKPDNLRFRLTCGSDPSLLLTLAAVLPFQYKNVPSSKHH
jgi:hypothetical protein